MVPMNNCYPPFKGSSSFGQNLNVHTLVELSSLVTFCALLSCSSLHQILIGTLIKKHTVTYSLSVQSVGRIRDYCLEYRVCGTGTITNHKNNYFLYFFSVFVDILIS